MNKLITYVTILIACFLTAWKVYGYTEIKIYPEHVGVFTTVGEQQFVAFGITESGESESIMDNVTWTSSDNSIATIDKNGLATVHSTSGRVTITAEYNDVPKVIHDDLCFVMVLLLGRGHEYARETHPEFVLPAEFVGQLVTPVVPAVQYPNAVEYLKRFEYQ